MLESCNCSNCRAPQPKTPWQLLAEAQEEARRNAQIQAPGTVSAPVNRSHHNYHHDAHPSDSGGAWRQPSTSRAATAHDGGGAWRQPSRQIEHVAPRQQAVVPSGYHAYVVNPSFRSELFSFDD